MAQKSAQGILAAYAQKRENLMPILNEFNDRAGYISQKNMQDIADHLNVSATEVYGAASFYAFFNLKPKGKYIIRLCRSVTCDLNGKARVAAALEKELKIAFGETTKNKMFTLEFANCMGMCDRGPAMLVNKTMHDKLTPQKVKKIIVELKKAGRK
jgi:NADH:ubiquinone oxidoreductase subunit E